MQINRRTILLGVGGALAAPHVVTSARAQAQVTLKLHHFLPAASNAQRDWFLPWAEKVGKESAGRIKVEVYPSMQLGGRPRNSSIRPRTVSSISYGRWLAIRRAAFRVWKSSSCRLCLAPRARYRAGRCGIIMKPIRKMS